jgi:hypothetical protein
MTRCIACGTENKAEARFCRQCGIRLESALAETDSDVTIAVPAPAAPAAAGRDDEHTLITRWASQRPAEPAGEVAPAAAEDTIPAAIPAFIPAGSAQPPAPAAPRRSRAWLIGTLAVAAVALIGAFAYLVTGSGKRPAEVAALPKAQPPAGAPAPAVVPPPPAPVALTPLPVEPPPAAAPEPLPAPALVVETPPPATAQPPTPRPAKPADSARERQKAERARREAAEAARRAAAQPAPAPPPAPVAAPAPAPEPKPVSRWDQMAQENSACEAENFFARLACKERVRWKYCPGFWGKVPQCPQATDQFGAGGG